jgi:hypothetical protein
VPTKVTPGPNPYVVHASEYARALATAGGGDLFTVDKRLQWKEGPSATFAALNSSSIWITGALTDAYGHRARLQRLDRTTLQVQASNAAEDLTSVALGVGSMWVATGHPNHVGGCDCTAAPARLDLVRLDPTTLAVRETLHLPEPPLLVEVGGGGVWVATPTHLLRVDPDSGAVSRKAVLVGYPIASATSADGSRLYVSSAGAHDGIGTESVYDTKDGSLLGRFSGTFVTDATPAVTEDGVWINEQHLVGSGDSSMQLLKGPDLRPGPTVAGFGFNAQPYIVGGRLWVHDEFNPAGTAGTTCYDAETGGKLGTGPVFANALGTLRVVISDAQGAFISRTSGFSEDLAAITPKPDCH